MLTIKDILGKDIKGDVGIELEAEFGAARAPMPQTGDWLAKPEGSLRGTAMEYVSAFPFKADKNLRSKIDHLCTIVNAPAARVDKDSSRTSVHVHVNVLDLTPTQLLTFGCAYWIIENALFNYCGPKRKDNLFCLRLRDAEAVIETIYHGLDSKRFLESLNTDRIRYCGINWNAVPKFGSLEFRGMRGTTDPEVMYTWSSELNHLKLVTTKLFENPSELFDRYANSDKTEFLYSLVGEKFGNTLVSYPNWTEGMDRNVETLCGLAYAKDWKQWSTIFSPYVKKDINPRANLARPARDERDVMNEPALQWDDFDDPVPQPMVRNNLNWNAVINPMEPVPNAHNID